MTSRCIGQARLDRLLRTVALDPTNLALRVAGIRAAFDSGEWTIARELLDEGLLSNPLNADLLALCGFARLQEKRYADAAESLASAVALGSQSAEVRYNLALARFSDERYSDALDVLTTQTCSAIPGAQVLRERCLDRIGHPALQESDAGGAACPA